MFRSLLHQLYQQAPVIRSTLRALFEEKAGFGKVRTDVEWQHKELEQLFFNAFIHESQQSCKDSKDFVDNGSRMERLILSLSGGLVEIEHHAVDTTTVQFIHQSVNDFLREGSLTYIASASSLLSQDDEDLSSTGGIIGQSQDRLCKSCANYLSLEEVVHADLSLVPGSTSSGSNDSKLRDVMPFGSYATNYWVLYAEKAENSGIMQQQLVQRLESLPGLAFQNWIRVYAKVGLYDSKCPTQGSTLLHIASASNLQSVVRIYENNTFTISKKDGSGSAPLHYAARRGHIKLVEMLLKAGANVEAKGVNGNTALAGAAENGHDKIVRLLLSRGAYVNERTGFSGNALQAAVLKGNKNLILILLDAGANINAQGGQYGNTLQAASVERKEEVVRLLLEKGADVNAQGGHYGNALRAASIEEKMQVVRLLFKKGAHVDT